MRLRHRILNGCVPSQKGTGNRISPRHGGCLGRKRLGISPLGHCRCHPGILRSKFWSHIFPTKK